MSEELSVTKEKLANLLKAAHSAYQSVAKPPVVKDDDWVEWYVNYVADKLSKSPVAKPADPEATTSKVADHQPENKAATSKLPDQPVVEEEKAKTDELEEKAKTGALEDKDEAAPAAAKAEPAASSAPSAEANSGKAAEKPAEGTEDEAGTPRKTEPDMGALQVCPTCAHRNRPGVLLCENCGTNLLTGQQSAVGTRDLRSEPEDDDEEEQPEEAQAEPLRSTVKFEDMKNAVKTAGTSAFTREMFLRIEIDGGPEPIIIKPKSEDMILGRRDPTTGATPEVDLTAFAGYRMGVSRRHASLALENDQLNLWDLGSSNGTFVNGTRLTPHQPNLIRDGDEVRLGQMVIRLFFQKTE